MGKARRDAMGPARSVAPKESATPATISSPNVSKSTTMRWPLGAGGPKEAMTSALGIADRRASADLAESRCAGRDVPFVAAGPARATLAAPPRNLLAPALARDRRAARSRAADEARIHVRRR